MEVIADDILHQVWLGLCSDIPGDLSVNILIHAPYGRILLGRDSGIDLIHHGWGNCCMQVQLDFS